MIRHELKGKIINQAEDFYGIKGHLIDILFSQESIYVHKYDPSKNKTENPFSPMHTVNSSSEMVEAKHVSGKNIFWSTLTVKGRGGKIFEFVHCPFEGRANMHHKIQPNWLTGRCCLAGGSKGQCRKSKIFLSLLLPMQVDQYIFFPETCFAPTISEPEFTV